MPRIIPHSPPPPYGQSDHADKASCDFLWIGTAGGEQYSVPVSRDASFLPFCIGPRPQREQDLTAPAKQRSNNTEDPEMKRNALLSAVAGL
ncbi:MAG: hypothetical protein Q8Q26_09385, partial [Pseudorhodobacter sp.]|nr:hypothetical protein [Pseudorhodobacter sp.]